MSIYEAYLLVSETASPKFTHLQKVIDLMLIVSCSSAKCERVFSSTKLMKTRLRSNLSQKNLQAQINVMVEGPPLHEFKASKAIEHWLRSSRGRHVNGHQAPERKPDKMKMICITMMNLKCMKNEINKYTTLYMKIVFILSK